MWKVQDEDQRIEKSCQKDTWKGSNEFCIFHDPSPEKDVDLFKEVLEEQMQSEEGRHDFVGYCFPKEWDFSGKEFRIDADFQGATFQGFANFGGATFQGNAYLRHATFQGNANFSGATFHDYAAFSGAIFQGQAIFLEATFQANMDFGGTTFQSDAAFLEATFQGDTLFTVLTFQGSATFGGATFLGNVVFSGDAFHDVYFSNVTFQAGAAFIEATFQGNVSFFGATFHGYADFTKVTFQSNAYFMEATFQGYAGFLEVTFCNADFTRTAFQKKVELTPKNVGRLNLTYTEFMFQSYITADLKRALFYRAFMENVVFVDCTWPRRNIIYEEERMREEHRTFKELETIYRGLKQALQKQGDYTKAGEFYYREMEMRRKGASKKERLWLELYRFLTGYGERPCLVIRNSFLVIFLAAILFFFCGVARVGPQIPPQENPDVIDYSLYSLALDSVTLKDFGYCVYYSVVTFTTLGYGDIHPLGYSYVLASAEALSGAFLMALFVVAFSRKVMR